VRGNAEKLALGVTAAGRFRDRAAVRASFGLKELISARSRGMNWTKATIFAVLIVTAIIVAIHYRKLAGTVVLPVTLVALYAVWRWGREA
jgi:hypothetical protein